MTVEMERMKEFRRVVPQVRNLESPFGNIPVCILQAGSSDPSGEVAIENR